MIGFRVYHPEGNRDDVHLKKYFGWSESFDEKYSAYSPRIQKYLTYANVSDDNTSYPNRFEDTFDDQMDTLLYSKVPGEQIYAVLRKKSKSILLVDLLNFYGESQGFQLILERLNLENHDQLGLETVFYYLDCFSKCSL